MEGETDPDAEILMTSQPADGSGDPTVLYSSLDDPAPPVLLVRTPLQVNTTFTISTPATVRQEAAVASATALVRFGLAAAALHPLRLTRSGTAVYGPHARPAVRTEVMPSRSGVCVHFDFARHTSNGWQALSANPCHLTDGDGTATLRARHSLRPGLYRVQPYAAADELNVAGVGPVVSFRVRR